MFNCLLLLHTNYSYILHINKSNIPLQFMHFQIFFFSPLLFALFIRKKITCKDNSNKNGDIYSYKYTEQAEL